MNRLLPFAAIVCLLATASCTMDWDNYVELLTRADSSMRIKQDRLESDYRLGKYKRYDYDEGLGVIVFSDSDVVKVVADVQFVGDISRRDSTWRWAWDLPYVSPELAEASRKARSFGRWRGVPPLKKTGWNGDRTDGWEMTSLTAWIAGADGAYSAPSSDSSAYTFMLLRNVRWSAAGKRVSDFIKSPRAARSNGGL